jgi:hypothetical protein
LCAIVSHCSSMGAEMRAGENRIVRTRTVTEPHLPDSLQGRE